MSDFDTIFQQQLQQSEGGGGASTPKPNLQGTTAITPPPGGAASFDQIFKQQVQAYQPPQTSQSNPMLDTMENDDASSVDRGSALGIAKSIIGAPARIGHGVVSGATGLAHDVYYGSQLIWDKATGQTDEFDQDLQSYAEYLAKSDAERAKAGATFADVRDFDGVGETIQDVVEWSSFTLGELGPSIAAVFTGATAGAPAVRAVARPLMRKVLRKEVSRAALDKVAQTVAASAVTTGLETSGIAGEQAMATGDVDIPVAMMAGLASGALEVMVPLGLGRAAGVLDGGTGQFLSTVDNFVDQSSSRWISAGGSFLKTGAAEGATEVAQEAIAMAARAYVDENYDWAGSDAKDRLLESFFAGFTGGGLMGAGIAAINPNARVRPEMMNKITKGDGPAFPPTGSKPTEGGDGETTSPTPPTKTPAEVDAAEGGNAGGTLFEEIATQVPTMQPEENAVLDNAVYATSVEDMGGAVPEFMEFQESGDAFASTIGKAKDAGAASLGFLGLQKDKLGEVDKTALLPDIIHDLQINPDGVQTRSNLDSFGEEGHNQFGDVIQSYVSGDVESAKKMYQAMVKQGLRFAPQEGEGYMTQGLPKSGVQITRAPKTAVTPDRIMGVISDTDFGEAHGSLKVNQNDNYVYALRDKAYRYAEATHDVQDILFTYGGLKTAADPMVVEQTVQKLVDDGTIVVHTPGKTLEDFKKWYANEAYPNAQDMLDAGFSVEIKKPTNPRQLRSVFKPGIKRDYYNRIDLGTAKARWLFNVDSYEYADTKSGMASLWMNYEQDADLDNMLQVKNGTVLKTKFEPSQDVKEGKANFAADAGVLKSKENARKIKRLTGLIQRFYNRMNPGNTLQVVFRPSSEQNEGYNVATYGQGQANLMVLTVKEGQSFAEAVALTLHEFAHYMVATYLLDPKTISSGLTMELYGAHQRHLKRAQTLRTDQFVAENYSFSRGLVIAKDGIADMAKPMSEQPYKFPYDTDYLLNFDEWLAENIVKYFEGNVNEYLGTTERFFGWLKGVLRKLSAETKKYLPELNFEVNDAVRAFADYTLAHDKKGFDLSQHIIDIQYNSKTWSDALGVEIDESSPSTVKKATTNLMKRPDLKRTLSQKANESGRTVGEELNVLSDASDHFNWIVKFGMNVLQLAQKNPHIRHLQNYVDAAEQWGNEKNFWQSMANDAIRHWQALGKARADRIGSLLFDLDSMSYLKQGEEARQPTKAELEELFRKHKMDAAMAEVYGELKDSFDAMLNRLEQVSISQLKRHVGNSIAFAIERAKIMQEFKVIRKKPYFPHSRFGNYAVVVTNQRTGKTVYVEHVEAGTPVKGGTPKAVRKAVELIRKDFPGEDLKVAAAYVPDTVQIYQGMPPNIIQHIKEKISGSLTESDKVWMDTLSARYAPSVSFRHRLIKRANTPGYSRDAMRSYASYFWHGSNHMARITYGQEMKDTITEFERDNSRRLRQGVNVIKRGKMVEYLTDHVDAILNPKPDWAQLRSMAFTWYLGFMPASALLNFTQLPIVTLPYLSSRFGDGRAVVAMQKAAWQLRRSYMNPEEMAKKWDPLMAKFIDLGLQQNFLEESMAMELAAVAEGGNFVRARYGSTTQRSMAAIGQASGWMFQGSEKINRRVTFIAATQLALKNPGAKYLNELVAGKQREFADLTQKQGFTETQAKAFLAGKDAVQKTQFEYGVWARPRFMRGKKGVIFTFYMFLQNMLFNVGNMPGRKRMLLTMFALGGLMGLPGAEDAEDLVEFAGRRLFGKRYKVSDEIRKYMLELTGGPRAADLLLHGTGREGFGIGALGDMLGLPLPYFDMSGSVGMGTVVPGLQSALNNDSTSFEETMGRMTTDIAGASLGVGINILKALNDTQLPIDDPKRWERAMPRAMKSVVRGMRYTPPDTEMAKLTGQFIAPEGRERTRSGSTVIPFDGNNAEHMAEIAMSMAGFQPTRLNRAWNDIIARAEVENYWKMRRNMLTGWFWQSLATEDPAMRADAIAAIESFNKEVPYKAMAITRDTLSRSVKTRKRIMARAEAGLPATKMYTPLHLETSDLFVQPEDMNDPIVEELK